MVEIKNNYVGEETEKGESESWVQLKVWPSTEDGNQNKGERQKIQHEAYITKQQGKVGHKDFLLGCIIRRE